MIGKNNSLVQLEQFDQDLYKNLKFLKNFEGNIEDLTITFTISDSDQKEIELIQNGRNIKVNNENKFKYIYLVADYKMNKCIKEQSKAFLRGLNRTIPAEWLQMFDEQEMQILISGEQNSLDLKNLQQNTKYEGYKKNDSYIKSFWQYIESFSSNNKIIFLKFVTSCERQPLFGFQNLNPPFLISKVDSENDSKLPSANTCFNKFNLPKYSSLQILKEKLNLALQNGVGFYLT
ncbi:ubiquitin protein ligase, putative [Ichthyophthirius multifiliis]|uniref:HECT-type E3 ubiquitin transferase n=1 Tax=Ichthyophthirius multifiliis TaxID=5932 RepID=G0R4D7_ICHMU|nr:ubiquitin protein ligase, putative [Ichthyophthirius multifiliis]EGR27666.1 ubiquitin protein ligase, putative [Ichthyophthirius multifiliis]|eukprot:XP_004025118.1 ubiquitin protein ligase, putative [Ichthyophthirius multifiliis]